MADDVKKEKDKISKILDLYRSLTDDGKDEYLAEIMDDEYLMGRLLNVLVTRSDETEGMSNYPSSYVDFLKRVKE